MVRTLALLLSLPLTLSTAHAQPRPITGRWKVVNSGPGDQTDPHVSGPLVAYTSEAFGTSEIRYHHLDTSHDAAIPNGGAFDFVSDISQNTVVFTRVRTSSAIFTYEVGGTGGPVELAPEAGSSRRAAVIGGRTVAWQDFGYTGNTQQPEIAAFDLDTGTLTRLSEDTLLDRTPAVAPDGQTVVWAKCNTLGQQCDVWQARREGTGFAVQALTGAEGEESQPDTNGEWVVYASTRTHDGVSDRDIYWKPVGGGAEQRLALPGVDSNPSISGPLVAFERRAPSKEDFDISLYDLRTQTLYVLTSSAANENLTDLSVAADGTVRVVWTVSENGDFNVHSFIFKLPEGPCEEPLKEGRLPIDVCVSPGNWPLLTSVQVTRTTGEPDRVDHGFTGTGVGVLCLDNGHNAAPATAGWVWLNAHEKVNPASFNPHKSLIAAGVVMSGDNVLTALIAGNPASAYRLRVYGTPPVCQAPDDRQPGGVVIPGQHVPPVTQPGAGVSAMTLVPEGRVHGGGVPGPGAGGCSTGGGSLALAGLMLVALWLWRPRQAAVVALRKELRRNGGAL
ncbi:MAG TPA: hypothetical protein VE153_22370 [Myxococcus sp.]|nr:hypothetical protein [Myxococcus sp.]